MSKRVSTVLVVIFILLTGALMIFRQKSDAPVPLNRLRYERQTPEFSLKDHAGHMHSLSEYKGDLLIVHFWATWCPPCVTEIPQVVSLAKSLAGKKIRILAISLDQSWEDVVKLLPDSSDSDHLVSLLDKDQKVAETFGSYQYPESYLVDPSGKIIFKWVGAQNWTGPEMTTFLDRALKP